MSRPAPRARVDEDRPAHAIAVVIPCYNGARYLAEAIDSVRRQTRPVTELIVVDDCSTDDSAEIARRLGATVLRTARNSYCGAARNVGMRAAHSALVAFLDADDFWEPDHCERVASLLDAYPEAAVAFPRARRFGEVSEVSPPYIDAGVPTWVLERLVVENIVPVSGAIAYRAAVLEAGGFEESLRASEDFDLWLRLARRYPFICTHAVTLNYRVSPHQISKDTLRLYDAAWKARRRLWRAVAGQPDGADLDALALALRRAWDRELGLAWRYRDRPVFDALLALADEIPNSAAVDRHWRRARRLWPLWVPAIALWDQLPLRMRRSIKGITGLLVPSAF